MNEPRANEEITYHSSHHEQDSAWRGTKFLVHLEAASCKDERASDLGQRSVIRLGAVPYLNVQPLIWPFLHPGSGLYSQSSSVEIQSLEPRPLAAALRAGQYSAAIVPVFEYLKNPDLYKIVSGVSIATRGAVKSVMLFSSVPIDSIKTVFLDQASLTSVHLVQVLLGERGLRPEYRDTSDQDCKWKAGLPLAEGESGLLIGDAALWESGRHKFTYDLGLLWNELTGLAFVFAAWLVHRDCGDADLGPLLRAAREEGIARIPEIAGHADSEFGVARETAQAYLTENIWYGLEEADLAGLAKFGEFCVKYGFIGVNPPLVIHV